MSDDEMTAEQVERSAKLGTTAKNMYMRLSDLFDTPAEAVTVFCEVLAMISAFQRADDVTLDDSVKDTCYMIKEFAELYNKAKLKTAD